ncbi:MAG: PHP domain-containing protein, partial [bacterium]
MSRQVKRLSGAFTILLAVFIANLTVLSSQAETTRGRVVKNPYENVNWDRIHPFIANLHAHTIYSDGRAEPEDLIHNYAQAGYHILAITDHDKKLLDYVAAGN